MKLVHCQEGRCPKTRLLREHSFPQKKDWYQCQRPKQNMQYAQAKIAVAKQVAAESQDINAQQRMIDRPKYKVEILRPQVDGLRTGQMGGFIVFQRSIPGS